MSNGKKSKVAEKVPEILGMVGSLAVLAVAFLIYSNKLPVIYRWLFEYFYIFAIVGILGILGESASVTLLTFVLPVALLGSTLALKFRPEKYPLEDWWNTYALLVVCSTGMIEFAHQG
ncbi:hypothetical protein HYY75_09165 [bacterium]|nr:hypothetical protein [bacterium]